MPDVWYGFPMFLSTSFLTALYAILSATLSFSQVSGTSACQPGSLFLFHISYASTDYWLYALHFFSFLIYYILTILALALWSCKVLCTYAPLSRAYTRTGFFHPFALFCCVRFSDLWTSLPALRGDARCTPLGSVWKTWIHHSIYGSSSLGYKYSRSIGDNPAV